MEPIELRAALFWEDSRPRVFAPPRLGEAARGLEESLAGKDWARNGVVFASSGSSGAPKWVLLRKAALLASAAMVNRHLGVSAGDHWLLALPGWHVGGFGVAARAFEADCGFSVLEGGWDAERFLEACAKDGATCTSLVPTQVHDLVAAELAAPDRLRVVVVGGGGLAEELGGEARRLGWPVLQSYGMSEAGSQIATAPLDSLARKFSSNGLQVLPGWEVETSGGGRLRVRGDALFEGYVSGAGKRLGADLMDGWFETKDLVSMEGGRLTFLGRSDRTVKILGELVELDALGRELTAFVEGKGEVRVVEVEDGRAGYRLVPVVAG
ncbi:MAG: AMP-binding protein, partial [Verrucomicrobia bacterium]|nr:AMP-binding protein [Verrucomicrobiota bacterium]